MRVIAGSARSLALKTVEGLDTRPTTDRIKETLFNMLNTSIPGCVFVDLFSGSGAIGIEALSRGAKESIFIENNKKACQCIKENLSFTKLNDKARVFECDVLQGVASIDKNGFVADIIFMDPPYNHEYEKKVLEYLMNSTILDEYTTVIVEASLDTEFEYVQQLGFDISKVKKYKTNKHVFLKKAQ